MLNSIFFLSFLFFIYISPIIIILYTIALVFVKYFKKFFFICHLAPDLMFGSYRSPGGEQKELRSSEQMIGNRSCEELPFVKSLGAVNSIILAHFCFILTKYEAIDGRKFLAGCFRANFRYLL